MNIIAYYSKPSVVLTAIEANATRLSAPSSMGAQIFEELASSKELETWLRSCSDDSMRCDAVRCCRRRLARRAQYFNADSFFEMMPKTRPYCFDPFPLFASRYTLSPQTPLGGCQVAADVRRESTAIAWSPLAVHLDPWKRNGSERG